MELDVNVAEVNLILQLARDSRALIARFTSAKTTPIHDRVITKCERELAEMESLRYPDGRRKENDARET